MFLTEVDSTVRGVIGKNEELQGRCQDQHCRITTLEAELTTLRLELDALRQQHTSGIVDSSKREEQLKQQISKQAVEYHHSLEIRKVEESRMRERIADLESKLSDTHENYLSEATAKRNAQDELGRVKKEAERAKMMSDTCNKLSGQIGDLEAQLTSATEEMDRYQCRNDQLIKQNKMLTVKQEQLLHQLEAFDLECETMREQLEAARDNSSTTTHELSDVVKQKRMLHSENTRLQDAIVKIQTDISNLHKTLNKKDHQLNQAQRVIEEEREKETTLISYPLLVGGERIPKELNRLVQANNIRILRLEEQNRLLRDTTLQRELEESQPVKGTQEPNPQPLWNSKCFKELDAIVKIQTDISSLHKTLNKKDHQLNQAQRVIEEEREKETTLISYPLLVGGERIPKELNRLVQANNIRILRLEEQNRLLRDTTLQRELEESQPVKGTQEPNPQPLWNSKCFKELVKSQHVFERVFTPIDYYDGIKSLVDG
eukprot:sb/3464196/